MPIGTHDPSAHAEIVALRTAAKASGNYRLEDCTLYVTLEPCVMCAGAMLNARLARVVYGAPDPKGGAAGSVVDVMGDARLNHGTRVDGGVLAEASRTLLQEFFQARRSNPDPLREDALRTPDERFTGLPDYPWQPRYVSDLPALAGLRLHYLDEGPAGAALTWLCLHGNHAWSYQYRHFIAELLRAGHRVVAPDLIGFGRSDKPKKASQHGFAWHRNILLQLVQFLGLRRVVLVGQGWGGALAFALPYGEPARYRGILLVDTVLPGRAGLAGEAAAHACVDGRRETIGMAASSSSSGWVRDEARAVHAPYPDRGHRAAPAAVERNFPAELDGAASPIWRRSSDWMREGWTGRSLLIAGTGLSARDVAGIRATVDALRGCPPALVLPAPDVLLPAAGRDIARHALRHFSA